MSEKSVKLEGSQELTPEEAAEALKEARRIIQKVGTSGEGQMAMEADAWMRKYFPNWA